MKSDFRPLFSPKSVAVLGASDNPGKLGFHVMKSLVAGGFPGRIFPVNPGRQDVLGYPAFPSLDHVPDPVDLAVMVVPAPMIPDQIRACARKDVGGIVLITAGFKEIDDPSGAQMEREIARLATEARIPIIGPNTFGMANLHARLNASFTPQFSLLRKGGVSLVSQSGGMSHLLAFLAMRAGVGFSKVIGLGNRCNVDFGDLLEWLSVDPLTRVIAMYMEGIDDPRTLIREARRLCERKPMLIYKCGRSEVADRASQSHTGSLAGNAEIYRGAFRQAGILDVDSAEALLDAAKALAICPLPHGPRVAILSGQAGPAMAAADVCHRAGLRIESFGAQTQRAIEALLPPLALRSNPVDMGPAWYDAGAIRGIVETVLKDPQIDALVLLIMFASANVGSVQGLAGLLKEWRQQKPVIGCISAPPGTWDEDVAGLETAGALVNYPTPERAAEAAAKLWEMEEMQTARNSAPGR
jgi:acyl-CoA synthetase (NDP forming)